MLPRAAATSTSPREDIFTEYAYFSSYSDCWVEHARRYVDADDRAASASDAGSLVVELASNDGYLLQYFVERGIPVLGIEPAANVAAAAVERGRPDARSSSSASRPRASWSPTARRADLVVGNNVLAHVPDLNDFVAGHAASLLAPDGVITMEFPHLLRLIEDNQFDTIYHEHFSYFSLLHRASGSSPRHGLTVVRRRGAADARRLAAHLRPPRRRRAAAGRRDARRRAAASASARAGFDDARLLRGFAEQVERDQARAARVPDRRQARPASGRRLRRAGQGQHAAQLLRHPHRLPRLHRRPQPVQAGQVPARHAHPDPPPGAHRRDAARLRPDPAVEPQGRDRRAARVRRASGAARFVVPDPGERDDASAMRGQA